MRDIGMPDIGDCNTRPQNIKYRREQNTEVAHVARSYVLDTGMLWTSCEHLRSRLAQMVHR
eukprot:jgi/Antlo1/449/1779